MHKSKNRSNIIVSDHGCVLFAMMLAALLLAVSPVAGETTREPATLDTVVVTAAKIEDTYQTGDVDTEQTPAFITVIEREQFEGKMEDIAEVMEKEAGIQVRQSGGLGSFSSVSLRGSTSEQVMVFLDGVLLNDASGGAHFGVLTQGFSFAAGGPSPIWSGP